MRIDIQYYSIFIPIDTRFFMLPAYYRVLQSARLSFKSLNCSLVDDTLYIVEKILISSFVFILTKLTYLPLFLCLLRKTLYLKSLITFTIDYYFKMRSNILIMLDLLLFI